MEQVHSQLREAVEAGYILRSKDSYRFLHDRVQEAAYSLIPEEARAQAHLQIGRLLAARTAANEREEGIFEIVNQFNRGSRLISSREEKDQLAELNLIAGKRAKASTAYASALHYLTAGAALLGDDGWACRPDLMFGLEFHRAECEFLTGELTAAEARLVMLASRAVGPVHQASVTCLRIDLYTTINRSDLAIDVALSYLRRLGGEWAPHPEEEEVRREYDRIWSLIRDRDIGDLVNLPVMSNPESVAAVEVLDKALPPSLFTDTNLFALLLWRIVNFSLENGNTDASCYAYVHGGALAGARFGNRKAGFRLGQVGYDLVEQRGLKRFKARTHIGFGVYTVSWTKHWRMARELIRDGFDAANTIGDVTWAAYSWHNLIGNFLASGDPLAEAQREAERGLAFAQKIGFGIVIHNLATQIALIRTLRGLTEIFGSFTGADFDEAEIERRLSSSPAFAFSACWYWIRKMQARFFAGDYSAALQALLNAQPVLWTAECFLEEAEACFYGALSHAASCEIARPVEYRKHLENLTRYHKQLTTWAENCPENFENRAALVGAEIARIEGRMLDAEQLYEQAIRSAHSNGFFNNAAIAYELAARFYSARGFQKFADAYLLEARYCYQRWGADGKVAQLDHLYPNLKKEALFSTPTSTILAPTELMDLATVIKVSQAVSGEMVLEKLIDSLMRAALEHAGAERGLLIVPRRDELQIEAEATISEGDVAVHLRDNGDIAPAMPESLVRYVMRTQENVILADASSQNPFSADPYIVQRRPRSILTLPLINRGKLLSILHLENNLTPDVFTSDRITILKVLASQAAMALENTRLYRDLEDRERKIRRLVDANVVGIVMWNLDGAITGANEAFLRIVQYDHEDLASGRVRWTDLTPAEWRYLDESAIAELKASGVFQPVEKEYFRKDGSRVPILVGGALFENSGNEGVAFILDLSDQKHTEAEIRALKDQLYKENLALRDEVERTSMFDEIVGTSNPLKAVLSRIAKVAPTDSTVLITGETGTGKELIARAIHRKSQRADRAFVSVNCAAIPRDLIPSELFGHEKGAFTGATQRRLGRFELADGGTIFLDEVGELLTDTQVALLRVLQERELERVGGGQPIHVDVRVIAATNRDLEAAVANGTFREDLFYRLNVFPIEVPPLRKRKEDLQLLVEYFVQRYGVKAGKDIHSIEKKTLDLLQSYDWPGNIRELQNVIERSVILSSGDVFSVDELWLSQKSVSPARPLKASAHAKGQAEPLSEREIIEGALAATRGRVSGPSGAAAKLGIRASTLEARIKALKINKLQFKFR